MTDAELRYERKFLVVERSAAEVEALVRFHPAHFSEPYPPRRINSVYFDTPGLRAYREAASGIARRTKVRLRWYGPLDGAVDAPRVEIKERRAALGTKHRYDAFPFVMREGIDAADLHRALPGDRMSAADAAVVAGLQPVLAVTYLRRYYLSRDGTLRLTVDGDLAYRRLGRYGSAPSLHRKAAHVVMELKYAPADDAAAATAAGWFPFRATRSSKYLGGVELLYAVAT